MASVNALIEELYREMAGKLTIAALRPFNGHRELAEEAVQRAFVFALEQREAFSASENPRGWIYNALKIAIDRILAEQKRDRELLAMASRHDSVYHPHHTDGPDTDVLYADLVDDPDYILLKRLSLGEVEIHELAKENGVSTPSMRKRIQRARERLRKKI